MEPRRASWLRVTAVLVTSALVVGGIVAALSAATAAPFCAAGATGEDCRGLVATLARRAGILAGAVNVLMALLAAGLLGMVPQDDRDRA